MKPGDEAERIAAGYLQRKGLALIETRYRCRWGEIDLVLRDRDTVVFTEVKLRRSGGFGGAAYSVGPRKQARMNQIDLDYSRAKSHYDDLLTKAREAAVNEVTTSPLAVFLLTPPGPAVAHSARDYVRLGLAPAFSLVVGLGLAFFLDGLDLTVRTSGQAEEALDLPVLAAITERRRRIG